MAVSAVPLKGAFSALQLPRLLPAIFAVCDRGRVSVSQPPAQRFVWFANGRVLSITSSVDEERLGTWLVARGFISSQALQQALTFRTRGERIGAALQRYGMVSGETISQELEVLTFALASKLLLEGGSYETDVNSVLAADAVVVDFSPEPLFALAARRAHDSDQLDRAAGGERRWVAAAGAASWDGDVELLGLEKVVLTRLTRPMTCNELQAGLEESPRQVARALACLAVLDLVHEASDSGRSEARHANLPHANPHLKELLSQIEPHPQRRSSARLSPTQVHDAETAEEAKQQALLMLRQGGDRRMAQKLLAAGLELSPDAACLTVLAELEMHNPLWRARALERLKQAVQLSPRHTAAWLALANYWSLRLQPEKQRRCLEKILAYEANNREAPSALALIEPPAPW